MFIKKSIFILAFALSMPSASAVWTINDSSVMCAQRRTVHDVHGIMFQYDFSEIVRYTYSDDYMIFAGKIFQENPSNPQYRIVDVNHLARAGRERFKADCIFKYNEFFKAQEALKAQENLIALQQANESNSNQNNEDEEVVQEISIVQDVENNQEATGDIVYLVLGTVALRVAQELKETLKKPVEAFQGVISWAQQSVLDDLSDDSKNLEFVGKLNDQLDGVLAFLADDESIIGENELKAIMDITLRAGRVYDKFKVKKGSENIDLTRSIEGLKSKSKNIERVAKEKSKNLATSVLESVLNEASQAIGNKVDDIAESFSKGILSIFGKNESDSDSDSDSEAQEVEPDNLEDLRRLRSEQRENREDIEDRVLMEREETMAPALFGQEGEVLSGSSSVHLGNSRENTRENQEAQNLLNALNESVANGEVALPPVYGSFHESNLNNANLTSNQISPRTLDASLLQEESIGQESSPPARDPIGRTSSVVSPGSLSASQRAGSRLTPRIGNLNLISPTSSMRRSKDS